MSWLKMLWGAVVSKWQYVAGALVVSLILGGIFTVMKMIRDRDNEIAQLATQLMTSEETAEFAKNLYVRKLEVIDDLNKMISVIGEENVKLAELLKKSQAEVLSLNSLVVKWKKAYEAALKASQTEVPPVEPGGPVRKRVDFSADMGYIGVTGHTLTDPPEGHVRVDQLRPLRLTLAVTKNRDGTWSSLVTSSEDNVGVDIAVSGIDLSVIKPRWYQRIWVDAGFELTGSPGATLGASYRWDRWSLGASCRLSPDGNGCGGTMGFRIFK